jgi:hypothetical protein
MTDCSTFCAHVKSLNAWTINPAEEIAVPDRPTLTRQRGAHHRVLRLVFALFGPPSEQRSQVRRIPFEGPLNETVAEKQLFDHDLIPRC